MMGRQGGVQDKLLYSFNLDDHVHGRFRDSETMRHVFESVLRRRMNEGLVEGKGFAIDASVLKADANRARGVAGEAGVVSVFSVKGSKVAKIGKGLLPRVRARLRFVLRPSRAFGRRDIDEMT